MPLDAPLTAETIALGRKLFYDRRLSFNNTVSCAMCHVPGQGFTGNETATSVGMEGRTVRRNAPTLFNVAYQQSLFHEGRETTLEQQVWGPLLAANEMGNPAIGYVLEKIKTLADYAGLFETAFRRGPAMDTLGMALAAYQRTLNAADSPFDRWRYGQQRDAITPQAKQGFELFSGKAGCAACHGVEEKYALFTDHGFHDTGIGYRTSLGKAAAKVQLAPGLTVRLDPRRLAPVSAAKSNDLGRYEITQDPADRWKYKTPSLRNVALTAPYMHDGSLRTLKEVVEFYNRGGVAHDGLDPLLRPLQLSRDEMDALVALLESLTGGNTEELMEDGRAAEVGDPH